MSLYEFSTAGGEPVELYFPIGTAPKIGSVHTPDSGPHEGVQLTRRPSIPLASVAPNFNFVAHSQCRNLTGHEKVDDKGRPVFTSKKEITEYVASTEGTVVWD